MTQTLALPSFDDATVVVPAPGAGRATGRVPRARSSSTACSGSTYRVRRPLREGRGVAVVVARSEDGERFVTVAEVRRDEFGAESFERPVLVRRPTAAGGSTCPAPPRTPSTGGSRPSTPTSPPGLEHGRRTVVLPGTADAAVKDPVVARRRDGWRMWVCCHPLTEPGQRTG